MGVDPLNGVSGCSGKSGDFPNGNTFLHHPSDAGVFEGMSGNIFQNAPFGVAEFIPFQPCIPACRIEGSFVVARPFPIDLEDISPGATALRFQEAQQSIRDRGLLGASLVRLSLSGGAPEYDLVFQIDPTATGVPLPLERQDRS